MKHKGKLAAGTAVLFALGIAGYLAIQAAGATEKDQLPVNERTYTVSLGDITVGIDGVGKLETTDTLYGLPKEITVSGVPVQQGDWVKKGDTLLELNQEQAQKYRDQLKKQTKELTKKLDALEDDRADFVDSLTWKPENDRQRSENRYYSQYYELSNRITNLTYSLSDAQWKRDYISDDQQTRATVEELERELADKRKELETLEEKREQEKAQENDPAKQKSRQEEALLEYDDKIAACKKELAALKTKQTKARSPKVTAEKEGVVLKVSAAPGDAPSVTLGHKEDMVLRLSIEPEDIVDVAQNQVAEFSLDAYPDQILTGTVLKRILAPDSNGKFAVLVSLPQQDELEILPGMSAAGILVVKQKKDVLTLPNKAITLRDGKQYIQVRREDGALQEQEIKTGFSDGKLTELLSGAKEGDLAITQVTL